MTIYTCRPAAVDNPRAGFAERLYAAHNRGGDPTQMGLLSTGEPCPFWRDLPQDIRDKWQAVADFALGKLVLEIRLPTIDIHVRVPEEDEPTPARRPPPPPR
jgi:hypothetical protein